MINTYKILENEKQKTIYYKCIVIDTFTIFKSLTNRILVKHTIHDDNKKLL